MFDKEIIESLIVETLEEKCCDFRNRFRSRHARTIKLSGHYGSYHGFNWDDAIQCHEPTVVGIRRIDISYGDQIDFMKVVYLLTDGSLYRAAGHRSNNNSHRHSSSRLSTTITLQEGERIVRVNGSVNEVGLCHLSFTIKNSNHTERKYGPFWKNWIRRVSCGRIYTRL